MKSPADADIPILLEPVTDAEDGGRRPLQREDQQPLFADLPPAAEPVKRKPAPSPAERLRAAREMLKARAPAIVEEVMAAHQQQLEDSLRARLQEELAALLADLKPTDHSPSR